MHECVRVEVEASRRDASLIKALAEGLRGDAKTADALRWTLEKAIIESMPKTAFDVFGSELPDEIFADVFTQPRPSGWRPVNL